ncbi:hypothetical protein [Shewanella surugensis]|uniref:Oligosaccharide repeat unit polymerase n=1 Tax=Shewanella surugensis TaxID=212020 RepID=A0ABT0L8S9_9GAMM|nr:hypothetical protein [Shewanella surugensis]MCL1123900.1 hypothetical protein [Shewanella surugensis]
MHTLEFLSLLFDDLYFFLALNFAIFLFLHLFTRIKLFGGVLNPIYVILVVGFSTKYAIVSFLYFKGYIIVEYVIFSFVYLLCLLIFYRLSFKFAKAKVLSNFCRYIVAPYERDFLKVMLIIYSVLAMFIIYKIGFGIFADTNRFENSRGFGAYIRIMDAISMFIVVYSAIAAAQSSGWKSRYFRFFILAVFVVFSAFLNGAKISILFSLMGIYLGLLIHGVVPKINFRKKVKIIALGLAFILLALSINLKQNNVSADEASKLISGAPLLVERFINRMISNGNTAYLLLPNEVIDQIDTDNIVVRLFTPIIGITQMSKLVGYNAGDYSVGRQALLYYDRDNTTAGGPTSHFDYFSYVYLGIVPGALFIILIGISLGAVNREVYDYCLNNRKSISMSAFFVTIWFRLVIVLVEPTVGMAYVFDVILIFFMVSILLNVLKRI